MRSFTPLLAPGQMLLGAAYPNFQDRRPSDLRVLTVGQPSEIILASTRRPINPDRHPASNRPSPSRRSSSIPPAAAVGHLLIIGCPNDPFAPAPPAGGGGAGLPAGGARDRRRPARDESGEH
jgi:hypothetical protein